MPIAARLFRAISVIGEMIRNDVDGATTRISSPGDNFLENMGPYFLSNNLRGERSFVAIGGGSAQPGEWYWLNLSEPAFVIL